MAMKPSSSVNNYNCPLLSESGESGVYRPEKSLQIYSLYFIDDG